MTGFGMIDTGAASADFAAAILAFGARISAVSDKEPGRAAAIADLYNVGNVYSDYRALLQDPEVEAVCLSNCGKETVIDAAQAGKHIFWRVPFAVSEEEIQQIANQFGVKIQCDFPGRTDPAIAVFGAETKRMIFWSVAKRLKSEMQQFLLSIH